MKSAPFLVAAASIGLLAFGTMPASAAGETIAAGDSLFAINCDDAFSDYQLYSVDSATAVSTAIGEGTVDTEPCAGQPAYNPVTGKSYYIQWEDDSYLASIDVATGLSTRIGPFDLAGDDGAINADALAIGGDGVAYVLDDGDVYRVNLDTGATEFVVGLDEDLDSIYSFAWDSVTNAFYGISWRNEVYKINVTDGTHTELGQIAFGSEEDYYTYSLQFDHEGTLWIEVDDDSGENYFATLYSLTLDTLDAPVYSGDFVVGDASFYTEALLVVPAAIAPTPPPAPAPAPEPALAATGADLADVLPWGIGAGVIVLVGGVLLILRSRRKPATTTTVASTPEIEKD